MRASACALSAFVYIVLTAILGRDVLAQLGSTIANDPGDPLLTAAILHWNATHIPWTEAWWQFPIYYPTRDTLAFSEHLLGLSIVATPIAWLAGNPLVTYNVTTLLTFPLCGMAMFALVYHLTHSAPGAFLAGLAYAFAPYRMSNLPHVQMLASFWAPLALLGLHGFLRTARPPASDDGRAGPAPRLSRPGSIRAVGRPDARGLFPASDSAAGRGRRWPWLALFGAGWVLQAAANWYTLVLFSVLLGLWVLWFVVVPRNWRALGMIAIAAGIAALPLAPLVYKYLTVHAVHGLERSVEEVRAYSADVAAVLCAPPNLTFWGWLRVACRAEGELFPGLALFVLFVAALVITVRAGDIAATANAGMARFARVVRLLRLVLLVVAALYGVVLLSVLVAGPWRVDAGFIHVSVSQVDKPLLIVLAAGVAALLITLGAEAAPARPSVIGFYLFAAVVTWLLALGPTVIVMGEASGRPGPFVLLQPLPGVAGMRVPARFWLLTVLCLTTVAGLLMARVLARRERRSRAIVLVAVSAALLTDGWAAPIPARPPAAAVADPGMLRDQVVLSLPLDPYPDIGATWRAVTGGWKSINGYSGYAPNYYTALTLASKSADDAMFAPFQRHHDLHVIVDDRAGELVAMTARQPGATLTAQGNGFMQYHLPRRSSAALDPIDPARRIATARSQCAGDSIHMAYDGDERTRWECLQDANRHAFVADLGTARPVTAIVYSVGPYAWNVPTQLAIETSVDGAAWRTVKTGSILGALIEGGLADADALRAVLPLPAHTARYVRVRPINQPAAFAWFVAEIEVRGP